MTRPADIYYEDRIRRSLHYRIRHLPFRWRWFYSPKHIRSFTWIHSGECFAYRRGCLTVRKTSVSPDWQIPEAYFQSVIIPLSPRQDRMIRSALEEVSFSQVKTTACSFVNWVEGGMITEDFVCRFFLGFTFRFAGGQCQPLTPLGKALEQIVKKNEAFGKIRDMESRLFSEQRWNQLHPDT